MSRSICGTPTAPALGPTPPVGPGPVGVGSRQGATIPVNAPATYAPTSDRAETRASRRTFTETKLGAKTTEFYLTLIAVAGIFVATYANGNDSLTTSRGWLYATIVAAAYVVSRGLAKLGSYEPHAS